uniref:sn-1-specific diacylglycerol lipase ABHD11 n=1 Tax=Macrostomum lignano TaxID=282301 RepID=A0A1I8FG35_9PLAT
AGDHQLGTTPSAAASTIAYRRVAAVSEELLRLPLTYDFAVTEAWQRRWCFLLRRSLFYCAGFMEPRPRGEIWLGQRPAYSISAGPPPGFRKKVKPAGQHVFTLSTPDRDYVFSADSAARLPAVASPPSTTCGFRRLLRRTAFSNPRCLAAQPPLLVLHGLFGMARNWRSVAKSLARNHSPIICADLRNHGDSPHHQDMSMAAMVGDVRQFIEQQLDATPVHLLGHSLGGKVAMRTALLHEPDCPGKFRWRINLPALLTHIEELMGCELNSCQAVYDGPTVFIGGSKSPYIDPKDASIQRLFPRSEIVFVEGAGHWVHADRPVEFCSKVTQFLRNCAQTAAAPGGS